MRAGYAVRASAVMMRHPKQGVERVRGRLDRHEDRRALAATGLPASVLYGVSEDWAERLHAALEAPWPCPAVESFGPVWDRIVAGLTEAGARVGVASYGGWNDGDRAFGEAIWCLTAHLRPRTVVETGVAHGLTSRVILEGLNRNGNGQLWSVDLPAVDSALHPEIGMAVPEGLRSPWTYVQGTARERLPGLLRELGRIDMFIHDSLHTGRNQQFELEAAWAALRPGGAAVVDDIDHSLAFRTFVDTFDEEARPRAWLAARHVTGSGLRGLAPAGGRLLQLQAGPGRQVLLFRDQLVRPVRPVIYDQADGRDPDVRAATDLEEVDFEAASWPAPDDHFDIVVWNRDIVTVKNLASALGEVRRVLRPGGFLVLAVPNLAAAHNRLLLLAGRQPTTLHITNGDHVRGFAAATMTRVLEHDMEFRVRQFIGVGIAPVTSALLPRPLRDLGHTVIWVLQKPGGHTQSSRDLPVPAEQQVP